MIDVPTIETISDSLYRISIYSGATNKHRLTILLPMSILAWCMPFAVGVSIVLHREPNFDDYLFLMLFVGFAAFWNAGFASFFYMTWHAEVDSKTRTLRTITSICGKRFRARCFRVLDGDELGISMLGMRSNFQHTIYCYHGRRRWVFLSFDATSGRPDQDLRDFAATIANHVSATFLGYNRPRRLIWI